MLTHKEPIKKFFKQKFINDLLFVKVKVLFNEWLLISIKCQFLILPATVKRQENVDINELKLYVILLNLFGRRGLKNSLILA